MTLLVVEDDSDLRELYLRALTLSGYAVATVGDGIDALRWMESELPRREYRERMRYSPSQPPTVTA